MIPCEENKCLLLGICKSKTEIEYTILADFYGMATDQTYDTGADVWDAIELVFPRLQEIQGPMVYGKTLQYRKFNIFKYPDPGYFNPGGPET